MSAHVPQSGEIYDLRSDGEIERNVPPRLGVVQERHANGIEIRWVSTGALTTWPERHFTARSLRSLAAWPAMVCALADAEDWLNHHSGWEVDPGAADLIAQVRAAICKAEGSR